MVFPKSNLSSGSVPWGREVQKRIEETDSKLASLGINDRSDTKQLQDSYRRLDATVQKLAEADVRIVDALALATQSAQDAEDAAAAANDAIAAITSLGSIDSDYTINAGNINGGTITGITLTGNTIKTAASGTRLELAGTSLTTYYNNGGTTSITGSVYGNLNPADSSLAMVLSSGSGGGAVYVSNDNINIQTGAGATGAGIRVVRNSGITMYPGTGATVSISSGNLDVSGQVRAASTANISTPTTGVSGAPLLVAGTLGIDGNEITTSGNLNLYIQGSESSGAVIVGSGGGDLSVRNNINIGSSGSLVISSTGGMYPTNPAAATGTANVRQAGSGTQILRVTSARRYKHDIQDVDYGLKALNLRPRTWIDKNEYEQNGNSIDGLYRIPGFVAEEVEEAGLEELLTYDYETGELAGLSYDRMVGALIPVIKHQQELIKSLSDRIEILEGK